MSPIVREYALAVVANGRVLYRRGEPPDDQTVHAVADEPIRLHPSEEWELSVRPNQSVLHSLSSRLPSIVLGAGLIISVLLATMVRLGQLTWAGSKELVQTNSTLQQRLRETERTAERNRLRAASLRDGKHSLVKENVSLRAEAQTRELSATQQDSIVAELEAFTYSVSHDLRSPLGAILNYAAVLSEDYGDRLDESGRDHLARISASARSAVAMMDGLLAFSRIGRHELKCTEIDLRQLVREVYAELCQAMPGEPPSLSMGEMPTIEADPTLMRVLITNLLSNAFKFTRTVEEARIEVGGYTQGTDTVYYVEDNGVGFDLRHADRLFGVFERLHRSSEYEGHGVGLAIVERITRRHGGSVRAEGVVDKGATFFVTLPNSRPNDDARNTT
jgi:light-regulated signal transduction histidine kinase (bacteriophytochrome)